MAPRVPAPGRLFVYLLILAGAAPCRAQTVIPRDTAPPPGPSAAGAARTGADSVRSLRDTTMSPGARSDSAARPAAAVAPTPSPPAAAAALPKGVCADPAGSVSADMLYVTFRARSKPAEREAALKPVHGTLVAPDPDDDASVYVRVPSDGNEFALRAIADRLIRVPVVKEVGPVQCPAGQ